MSIGAVEHVALGRRDGEQARRLPSHDLIDRDRQHGVEQQIDIKRRLSRSVNGAAAADRLHQLGLANLPAHGLDEWIGMLVAPDRDRTAVAQPDAALHLRVPRKAPALRAAISAARRPVSAAVIVSGALGPGCVRPTRISKRTARKSSSPAMSL